MKNVIITKKYKKVQNLIQKLKDNNVYDKDNDFKEKFFEFGATLFIYGSKKIYKKYCFFREIGNDLVKKTKYY